MQKRKSSRPDRRDTRWASLAAGVLADLHGGTTLEFIAAALLIYSPVVLLVLAWTFALKRRLLVAPEPAPDGTGGVSAYTREREMWDVLGRVKPRETQLDLLVITGLTTVMSGALLMRVLGVSGWTVGAAATVFLAVAALLSRRTQRREL